MHGLDAIPIVSGIAAVSVFTNSIIEQGANTILQNLVISYEIKCWQIVRKT